jgi:hypothetical protein
MKNLILILCLTLIPQYDVFTQVEFELNPSQSMVITGKGIGQDAAKNPYEGQSCFVLIKNIGKREFSIRTQQHGEIIENIPIKKGETKKVKLLIGYELYLDTNDKGKAKATVEFEK